MVRTACSSVWSCQLFLKQKPFLPNSGLSSTRERKEKKKKRALISVLRCAWHMFGHKSAETRIRCQNQTSLIRFQKREWDGFEQKQICFVFFNLSLSCSFPCFFFKAEWMSDICLDVGSASDFMSREWRGWPLEKLLGESLQAMREKVNTLCIQKRKGSLSRLISEMKCFPPAALTIQASALPQTNPSKGSMHVRRCRRRGTRKKGCLFR